MRHEDLILPESVSVVYPTLRAGYPTATPAVYSITLTSLAIPTLSGVVGRDGFTRVLHSSATASYADVASTTPSNDTELQALANQIATDFYLHLAGRAEVCLSGIQPWLPSGLEDVTEWDHSGEHIVTRSRPCAWLDGPDDLWHHGTYGSASPPTSGGVTYVGGAVQYIGVDVTLAGGSLTVSDGLIQLTDSTTLILEDGSTFLLEDDGTLIQTGGGAVFGGYIEICGEWRQCQASSVTITSTTHDSTAISTSAAPIVPLDISTIDVEITGFVPVSTKQRVTLQNVGTKTVTLKHENTSSAATNRIYTPTEGDLALPPGKTVDLWYDSSISRWRTFGGTSTAYDRTPSTPPAISTNQNNYVLTSPTPIQRWNITGDITLTGIVPAQPWQAMTITNVGTNTATIPHDSASSTAENRIYTPTEGDISLAPGRSLEMLYDSASSRWRVTGGSAVSTASYATTIGDGAATTYTITHNLGTRDVAVMIYEAAGDYDLVYATVKAATTNTVTVTFTVAPSASQYRVVVVSGGAAAATLADGDRGDITVSASGATWTIDNDVVTYAKMQNVSATSRVLGRKTAAAGDAEECTLSEILDFVGSAAQGDILYRGAATWTRLGAGTNGHFLKTQGAGADPVWAATSGSGVTVRSEGTLAATGSVQGDAAAIVTDAVEVSGADGTKGVILPGSAAAAMIAVWNTHASNSLKVYPPSGAAINTVAANGAITMSGKQSLIFYRITATQWFTGAGNISA